MKTKLKLKTLSAKRFRDKSGYFIFPFQVLDDRTDGTSLGRIMWNIELLKGRKQKGRYFFEKILVWAKQTRDERYMGKVFEIPCYSEAVTGDSLDRESYLNYVWYIQPCEIHNSLIFSAYPANHHKALRINVGSLMSIDIDFI
jgi:hypothetical protein